MYQSTQEKQDACCCQDADEWAGYDQISEEQKIDQDQRSAFFWQGHLINSFFPGLTSAKQEKAEKCEVRGWGLGIEIPNSIPYWGLLEGRLVASDKIEEESLKQQDVGVQ